VARVLPIALARGVFRRAERLDVAQGGRFLRRGDAVLVWAAAPGEALLRSAPVGAFRVRRGDPDARHATLYRLEWDAQLGSEAEVRAALEVLAGGPILS
jgi:hypothetical protein